MTFHRIACLLAGLMFLSSAAFAEPGLIAKYSDGKNTVQTVVVSPAFSLRDNESVHPQIGAKFTAQYDGQIKILRRAKYTFNCDGKLTLDGKEVTGPIEMDPGEHAISIAYERKQGPARLEPIWSSDQFIAEPIPASVLSHKETSKEAEQQALIERGQMVVEERNCAGCHKNGAQGLVNRIGPDLSNIGGRANAFWIYKWLENPQHFRAAALMPVVLTKDEDRRDAAAYLALLKDPRKRITEYKHSSQKEKEGKQLFSSIGFANCHNDAGPSLTGMGSKSTIGQLAAYLEEPTNIDRSGRMPAMQLSKEEAVSLADHLVQSKSDDFTGKLPEGADARHGEQLVRSTGCLNCHTIDGNAGKPLPESKKFPALDKLDPTKGCLAEKLVRVPDPAPEIIKANVPQSSKKVSLRVGDTIQAIDGKQVRDFSKIDLAVALAQPEGVPNFGLSDADRKAAAAFLTSIKTQPLISSAPAHEFHRTLQKMNCSACHETDQAKPVSEDAEKLPPLTNVGAKLRREWIQQVLNDKKARVRFWLKTRMPEFGGAVSNVSAQAVASSGVDEREPKSAVNPHAVAQGQELVGANDPKKNPTGMGCVTCHSLREFKPAVAADATRGPELTLMTTRLRHDFFQRWMHEPARIQPGTAMPNFFTDKSREEADLTTEVLWSYASLGIAMPAPKGIKEKKNYILIVTDAPLVQRCQVPDPAGTIVDAISVGFPEMVNYTFDSDQCMFRSAWAGPFLDMTGDWNDRGGNPVRVLGRRFYSQAAPPLHIGNPDSNEPRVFKGYELKDKIPTFIYTIGGIEVRERITALPNSDGIVRTFELDPAGKPVYFTAADDPNVTLSINNGQFKAGQVEKSFKSPEKTAGQIAELPSAGKLTFAVTIKAKDTK